MMLSALRTSAARAATRRPMSTTAAPKMHKAKDAWVELKKTRPPPGHDHVSTKSIFLFFQPRSASCCQKKKMADCLPAALLRFKPWYKGFMRGAY